MKNYFKNLFLIMLVVSTSILITACGKISLNETTITGVLDQY